MALKIKIKGADKVIGNLNKMGKEAINEADKAVFDAALFLQGEVVESIGGNRSEPTSVDTGRFKNSIEAEKKGTLKAEVHDGVEYGVYLEYGTSRIAPRYHFRNSISRNQSKITKFVNDRIKEITK